MDFATLFGIIAGLTLIFGSIMVSSSIGIFLHVPSIFVTVGGTIAATLINFPMTKVLGVFSIVKKTLVTSALTPTQIISDLLQYNQSVRKDGIMVLEEKLPDMPQFMQSGVQLILDSTPPESIREILTLEIDASVNRHIMGKKILETMGAAAPAFGMIGTLIGLVQMLQNLEDPSMIGQGMAVALLTTFYGALMANLVFLPLAGKLESRNHEEQVISEIMLEGILSIQAGEHPLIMKEKLKVFIPSSQRKAID